MTILYWFIGFFLTAVVVWLGLIPFAEIQRVLVIFGLGLLIIMIMTFLGRARYDPSSPLAGAKMPATGIGLMLLAANAWALQRWLGLSWTVPASILVAALFAIYEETGMLGIRIALKGVGLPDYYVLILEVLLFVPLHAFSYSLAYTAFVVFLVLGRAIMSGVGLVTDASSVPYNVHVIYNVIQAGALTLLFGLIFGGI